MTVDILSDLHIDFYFRSSSHTDRELIEEFYSDIFPENTGDALIVAGDIGHYNDQNINILKIIKEIFDYKNIICVLGNHDYYLTSGQSRYDYANLSMNRVKEMRALINAEDGMHCLDGDVIEIAGIKIGGCDSWYDGEYIKKHFADKEIWCGMNDKYINILWERIMADAEYVKGLSWMEYAEEEKSKIEKIYKDIDIMITHVNPSLCKEHTSKRFRDCESTGFFTFDGTKFFKEGSMRYWIFGHTHDQTEFEMEGVKCICNPMGYPSENNYGELTQIRSIEL